MSLFAILAIFTLAGLLYSEYQQSQRLRWIFKPTTSVLFLLTALTRSPESTYDWLIFIGLVSGFLGDVFLIVRDPRWFLAGLIVFLLGHVLYVIAFNSLVSFTVLSPIYLLLTALLSGGFFIWLNPKLGDMQIPVLAYVLVITVMLWSAWAVYFETEKSQDFQRLVAIGATCFYLSDMAVAIDRFVKPAWNNAYWGLPLYYIGQFLLAFSVGMSA